ncbi:Uncharacterised protein [Yersinia massiliensis]|uniref:hypothetical protein n=1 Tax=Yersinia massiliensis TaxID=419257 RepID=UPI0005E43386|nr:Uncharacterised protein [Yersinia massiliensis]
MVESMIGLLRQEQDFTQATRYYEGFSSDPQFPVVQSLSLPNILTPTSVLLVYIPCNTLPCDTVVTQVIRVLKCSRYSHFSLASIGCEGSHNLIRM